MADCLRLPQYVAARKRVVHCVIWSPCSTLHAARGGRHPLPRSTSPPRLSPLALPVRNPFAHDDTPALALPDTRPNLKVDEAAGRVDLPPLSGLLPETPQRLRGGLIPLLCRLAVPLHGILLARCDPAPYLIHPTNRTGSVPLFGFEKTIVAICLQNPQDIEPPFAIWIMNRRRPPPVRKQRSH